MRSRDVYVIDTDKVAVSYLRSFVPQDIAKVGDADTKNIVCEYTLEMRAPDAHALIADTNG
jgi:hypothetical protein